MEEEEEAVEVCFHLFTFNMFYFKLKMQTEGVMTGFLSRFKVLVAMTPCLASEDMEEEAEEVEAAAAAEVEAAVT